MRCMIALHFDTSRLKEMSTLIPKEQEHVKALMEKGILEAIYISEDRSIVWLVMKKETLEQLQQELTAFPLYPYMMLQFVPLT